jgi:hypothetical protein
MKTAAVQVADMYTEYDEAADSMTGDFSFLTSDVCPAKASIQVSSTDLMGLSRW